MHVRTTDLERVLADVREHRPLVQCLTNYVSMDVAANVLLAVGASPAMVHAEEEAGELAGVAGAVCVNIGTVSTPWVAGMHAAAEAAGERGTPWVLDPVAVGATDFRRRVVSGLLERRPTVVRANAGEVLALAGDLGGSRGVDSTASAGEAVEQARRLAAGLGCVVAMSGERDVVTDGRRAVLVGGGDPRMPLVTALGCSLSAVVAACCAVHDDALVAATAACAALAVAGTRAGADAAGPASLRVGLVDALAGLAPGETAAAADLAEAA
jgi:hydroxyethylthiazole kinase